MRPADTSTGFVRWEQERQAAMDQVFADPCRLAYEVALGFA